CATCDADFFEDLELLVVGNGDAAIEEAMHLTKFASKVTIVVIHDQGILDCNKASAARAFKNPQIAWIWHSVLDEIKGNDLVESVMIKDLKTNQISELAVSGVFFFVGTIPKTDFIKDQVTLNKQGYIMTNEIMETNLPGVYAAGDARAKYLRQIITSAADGAIAAFAAEKYLVTQEIFQQEILSSEKPVLLIFWTPQQEKTMEAATMLENLAQEHYGSFKAVKMDASRNQNLVSLYQIENLPTILAFKNGKLTGRLNGFSDKKTIENLL
ncbi:MAG: FAD-dependent oxidoreductase, partial [Clostridiales bacterium]